MNNHFFNSDSNFNSLSDCRGSEMQDFFIECYPTVYIYENNKEFHIDLYAPGFNKEEFSIELNNNRLSIYAQKKAGTASFKKTMKLPHGLNLNLVKLTPKNACLNIVISKNT